MNVYLAGPMGDLPRHNFDAFEEACDRLRADGFSVTSPHEMDLGAALDPEHPQAAADLRAALERDIAAVKSAEIVFLLPGWAGSAGAQIEVLVASAYGVPCVEYAAWGASCPAAAA